MQFRDLVKLKTPYNFLLLWFVLSALGWFKLISVFSGLVVEFLPLKSEQVRLLEWSMLNDPSAKPGELIQFGLTALALFIFFLLTYLWLSKKDNLINSRVIAFLQKESNHNYLVGYFVLLALFSILLWLWVGTSLVKFIFCIVFWSILSFLPFTSLLDVSSLSDKKQKYLFYVISGLLFIELIFMLSPFIFGRLFVANDYMDIPEQTFLNGRYVDNTSYINTNNIGGVIKYDPRIDKGSSPIAPKDLSIKLNATEELLIFVEPYKHKYFYDTKTETLTISGPMTNDERSSLEFMIGDNDKGKLMKMFTTSNMYYPKVDVIGLYSDKDTPNLSRSKKVFKNYDSEAFEFIMKNKIEIKNQALAGHFFHHHNYQLGPLNERILGKDPAKINYTYGWFSSIMIEKIMQVIGGINFQNYFKTNYIFYLIYYLIIIAVISIIFRDIRFTSIALLIMLGSLHYLRYPDLIKAPGFNPIRHFFDPLVLLFLFYSVTKRKYAYLITCLGLAAFSILVSKEFGIFMFLALATTLALFFVASPRKKENYLNYAILFAGIIAAFSFILMTNRGANSLFFYTLIGVSVPLITTKGLILFQLLFVPFYIFIIKSRDSDNPLKYLLLYLLLYTQMASVYFVWNPAFNHLHTLAPIWGIMLVILFKMALEYPLLEPLKRGYLLPSALIIFSIYYVPAVAFYNFEKYQYDQVRESHRIYEWKLERASFDSTMDPSLFEHDVKLINKYAPNTMGIYIISKYDNLLPFISKKYSTMPYIELVTSLVTKKEINNCINIILKDKPDYIFVDTDIDRNFNGDIYYENDPVVTMLYPKLNDASRGRVIMFKYLREVYHGVAKDFEMVENGLLISVYKRKNS